MNCLRSNFAYAHNSYIVNLKYVKKLSSEELKLVDGQVLSVSTKIKNLRKQVTEYFERKYGEEIALILIFSFIGSVYLKYGCYLIFMMPF